MTEEVRKARAPAAVVPTDEASDQSDGSRKVTGVMTAEIMKRTQPQKLIMVIQD